MIYIDDSIMQKGCQATAGSKILENFIAPFDATVVTRLSEKIEMVKLAEFGLGDPGELPGSPLLCNDIFGHVRHRAAIQGLFYIRPTYGTVSRYGLIPAASSMDQIGIVCREPAEGFSLLSAIAGNDPNDGAMFPEKNYTYKAEKKELRWSAPHQTKAVAGKSGAKGIIEYSDTYGDIYNQIMAILGYAEISNNISRYDGLKFGFRAASYKNLDDLYIKTRTEGFGLEAKLVSVMGFLVLTQDYYTKYYDKALKIRRLIKESLRFDTYDVIALPVDNHLAVLAGLPSLTFNCDGNGVQLVADVKKENVLLSAWEAIK